MNEQLLTILKELQSNPAVVVDLYQQLFQGRYWALIAQPSMELSSMAFLTYTSSGGVRELPLFTDPSRGLIAKLASTTPIPAVVELGGQAMWSRMLDVVPDKQTQVAIDPGETYGIRLTREMILGMIGKYGENTKNQ
jgi:hypothetical protein